MMNQKIQREHHFAIVDEIDSVLIDKAETPLLLIVQEKNNKSKTLAMITYSNYFKLYEKFSGMAGTAKTEESEFIKIYGLDVVSIPTNKPLQRRDELDESLRQHAGIQGDVGECVFYLSLQDRIFVAFDVSEELICNATNLGADDINPFMDLSVTMLVNNLQYKMGQFRIERLEQSLFFDDIIQERRKIKDETKSRLFEIEDMLPIITHGVEVLAKDISKKSVDDINLVLEPSIFPKGLNFVKEEDGIELRNKKNSK